MASLARLADDKRQFANRVRGFAKRAGAKPAFPVLELICVGVAGLATVSGAFGTAALPLPERTVFWLALMAWSALKWRLWFTVMVRENSDWVRAGAIGTVLLNLLLPLEIKAAMRLVGINVEVSNALTWFEALAISAIIAALVWSLRRLLVPRLRLVLPGETGPLVRAGERLDRIGAVRAEDHYCRVYLADGATRLVLCRFGDALDELTAADGSRIHRSAWVADWAVERAERDGRAWKLHAAGAPFAVSAAHVAEARKRGWLNRR